MKDYRVDVKTEEEVNSWLERLKKLAQKSARLEFESKKEQDDFAIVENHITVREWTTPFQNFYLNMSLLIEDLGKRSNITKNTKEEMIIWIQELLRFMEHDSHRIIRTKDLEEINLRLARKLNNIEWELRMVKREATESIDNVLDFIECRKALQTGGLPPDGDWLTPMKLGTEFLVRPKTQKTWVLAKFMQAGVRNGNVLLIPMQGEAVTAPDNEWIWTDPVEFCKFWELKGILLEPIDE